MEEQRTEIAQQIVDTYPYPIATGVQKLLTSTEAFEKTAHLMSAFGLTLKYLTSIAIASYVQAGIDVQKTNMLIAEQLTRRPTLGSFIELLRETTRVLTEDRCFVPKLLGFLWDRSGRQSMKLTKNMNIMENFVRFRNRVVHADLQAPMAEIDSTLDQFWDLLQAAEFLKNYPLIVAKGNPGVFQRMGLKTIPVKNLNVPPGVYLVNKQEETLDLQPLLVYHEGILGFYDHSRRNKLVYQAVEPWGERFEIEGSLEVIAGIRQAIGDAELDDAPAESAAEVVASRNSIVDRLVNEVIRKYADNDSLQFLQQKLRNMNYQGDADALLIDYCLNEDPVKILDNLFNEFTIWRIAADLQLKPASQQMKDELVKQILNAIGFVIKDEPRSLKHCIGEYYRLLSRMPYFRDQYEITGTLASTSADFEAFLQDIAIFYGYVFFGTTYEDEFTKRGWKGNKPYLNIRKLAGGTLVDLLRKLEEYVVSERTQELHERFGRDYLIGDKEMFDRCSRFISYRNKIIHPSDDIIAMSLPQFRQHVNEVLQLGLEILRTFDENEIYPKLVTVESFVQDHYGRKFILCIDSEGNRERIFTDKDINPRLSYFMLPLTNPTRIYPLLFEYK